MANPAPPPVSARVIAFAYDNPVYEDLERAGGSDLHRYYKPEEDKGEDKAAAAAEDEELIKLFYPDQKTVLKWLQIKFWVLIALVLIDIVLVCYTDPFSSTSTSVTVQGLIIGAQIALVVAIMISFFILTNQTLLVELGQYDQYLARYWWFYSLFLIELLLLIGVRAYYIVFFVLWESQLGYFDLPGYLLLWTVHRIVLLLFWIVTVYGGTTAFNPSLYSARSLKK